MAHKSEIIDLSVIIVEKIGHACLFKNVDNN